MKNKEFFDKLIEKIQPFFREGTSHGFSHTERVFNNALMLSKEEDVDIDVVKASSLLHDIARMKEDCGEIKCHAKEGAEMAEKILKELNFPEDKIKKVVDCIFTHRYSNDAKPSSKEAEILWDSDKLDLLGTIGIGRTFIRGCERKEPMQHSNLKKDISKDDVINRFKNKLLIRGKGYLYSTKAKKIAEERYEYTKKFVELLEKEIKEEQ